MPRKNHTFTALSELHDLLTDFRETVECSMEEVDDGDSHTKQEARTEVDYRIACFLRQLNDHRETVQTKYR
jgi:hypothetical protein